MPRPPILNKDGKLSEFVKGIIRDRKGNLMGFVLETRDEIIIEFLAKLSVIITIDKKTKEIDMGFEPFIKDPKNLLERLLR